MSGRSVLRARTKQEMNRVTKCGGAIVATAKACLEGHFQPRLERNERANHTYLWGKRTLAMEAARAKVLRWECVPSVGEKASPVWVGQRQLGREQGR